MAKNDYKNWSKDDLVKEVERLRKRKKYGLVWEDKPEEVVEQCKTELPVLDEVADKEINTDPDKPVNLLIEGDNYHALSVLNYTHKGKVDVIYIDPPYNTGNKDFIYNDHYVDSDDAYRHSKWLSFMSRRLQLAKDLLRDNGIIAISIDDNELAQLKLLCDDIFDEKNLLDIFHIQVRYASKSLNEKDDFQKLMEQVLIYAKKKYSFRPNKPKDEYDLGKFKYEIVEKTKGKEVKIGGKNVKIFKPGEYEIIKHKEGTINLLKATWASGSVLKGNTSGKFFHEHLEPRKEKDGLKILYKVEGIGEDGLGYRYFTGPKRANATKGQFYSGVPTYRREEIENGGSMKERPIINYYDYSGDFGNIRHEGGVGFRSGKKPVKMLKDLINLHRNKKATVLDFFAGSGSTGHAVLDLNKDDEGERRFILSTNNEDNNGRGRVADDICYPRIKNVIEGYAGNEGIGGNLKYFRTSFVPAEPTDKNKTELTEKATEMLCVREDTFELVKDEEKFKIFKGKDHHTGIIFDQLAIDDFKKAIAKIDSLFSVYVFSLGDDTFDDEFADVKDKVTLSPIPEAILRVYRRIFK